MKRCLFMFLILATPICAAIYGGATSVYGSASGGGNAVVVAASNAPDKIKAKADYRCDGTDDHVEIQMALDSVVSTGGVVELTAGVFFIGQSDASPAYKKETGVALTKSPNSTTNTILTVADASLYSVGDFLRLTGGDNGSGATMEQTFVDTYVTVLSVDTDTEQLGTSGRVTVNDYTGVTVERLAWSIRMTTPSTGTRSTYLQGSGIHTTFLQLQAAEDCIGLYLVGGDVSNDPVSRIQSGFSGLQLQGQRQTQTDAKKGASIGVAISATAQDMHIQDVAVWYWNGPGVVADKGWGNHWVGGWLEYNNGPCLWVTKGGEVFKFERVKIINSDDSYGHYPAFIAENRITFMNGYLAQSATEDIIKLRGTSTGSNFTGNTASVTVSTKSLFATENTAGLTQVICTGNHVQLAAGTFLLNGTNGNPMYWTIVGNTIRKATEDQRVFTGVAVNIGYKCKSNVGISALDEEKDFVVVKNSSGGSLTGRRMVAIAPAVGAMPTITYFTGNSARYGIITTTTANTAMGYAITEGIIGWTCAAGTAVGNRLTIDSDGKGKPASTGEWAYAVALQARVSEGDANVMLLPFPVQEP